MNYKRAHSNWAKFRQGAELKCNIALLNEAIPPPEDLAPYVEMEERAIGRDDVSHAGKKVQAG